MRTLWILSFSVLVLFLWSCGSDTPADTTDDSTSDIDSSSAEVSEKSRSLFPAQPPIDCEIGGSILEENRFWSSQSELLVTIKADSTTRDSNLGESHRILEVYDKQCSLLSRTILPINQSPDFPYYLAEIIYNNSSQVLPVKGFNTIYLYDLSGRQLLPQIEPQFTGPRYGVDAQSGRIEHLEVWENYLIGHSRDYGSFVFRLEENQQVIPVPPFAEYQFEDRYYPVFALRSGAGARQLLLPSYDRRTNTFSINPVLQQPLNINTEAAKLSQDSRFVALPASSAEAVPILLDLRAQERVSLPGELQKATLDEIIRWARTR
jgi:hypothetical protein